MPDPKDTIVEVTPDNAEEIARKEFEAEKAEKEGKKPPEDEKKEETTPEAKTDEELLAASDEDLGEEEKTRKEVLVKAKEAEGEKAKSDEQLIDAKDEDLNTDEKARKETLLKDIIKKDEELQKENERILSTEDSELNADELARKKELLTDKGKESQEQEKARQAQEKAVKTYAKENNISEEQAKEELESIDKIEEKYSKEPKKLAKATLHIQRLFTKTNQELKALQERLSAPQLTTDLVVKSIKEGNFSFANGKKATEEEVLAAYRERYPDITEDVEDEKILKMAAKEIKEAMESRHKSALTELTGKAREKRDNLLSALPESDKKFLPEIKPVLEKTPDRQVMQGDFDLGDLILWAKGKGYDAAVRKAEEDAFKRGRASASTKIKTGPIGTGSAPGPTAGPKALVESQKTEALEMFPSSTPEEAYKLYADLEKDKEEIRKKRKGKDKEK